MRFRLHLLLLSLLLTGVAWAPAADGQVVVIAHAGVPVDSLGRGELLNFYTGDVRSWPDGQPVVVLDLREGDEVRKQFYGYLDTTPSRMKSVWLKRRLSGEGRPPESLGTPDAVVARVARTPGAIGFVPAEALLRGAMGVKVLIRIWPD